MFRDDIFVYVENSKESTKNPWNLTEIKIKTLKKIFIRFADEVKEKIIETSEQLYQGYRIQINIKKPISFLYSNKEQMEFEIKNTISFIFALSKMKHVGINVTKYV